MMIIEYNRTRDHVLWWHRWHRLLWKLLIQRKKNLLKWKLCNCSAVRKQSLTYIYLNLSWPAVSQICSLIFCPATSIILSESTISINTRHTLNVWSITSQPYKAVYQMQRSRKIVRKHHLPCAEFDTNCVWAISHNCKIQSLCLYI